jgi:uncharacterized membrane protein
MNSSALKRLILSTLILIVGVLLGMTLRSLLGVVFLVAGIAGFVLTGGIKAYKDTFFNSPF